MRTDAKSSTLFFEGAPTPRGGTIEPDPTRPGLGLDLERRDAAPYQDERR